MLKMVNMLNFVMYILPQIFKSNYFNPQNGVEEIRVPPTLNKMISLVDKENKHFPYFFFVLSISISKMFSKMLKFMQ